MGGFYKGVLVGVAVVFLIFVVVLGFMGFIPGLSGILSSSEPENLGVSYNQQDIASINQRTGVETVLLAPNLPPEKSIQFNGETNVNLSITENEITAVLNDETWAYYPLHNCQVKINSDEEAEFSGVILSGRLEEFMAAFRIQVEDYPFIVENLRLIRGDPPFYCRGNIVITRNRVVSLTVFELRVGSISIPLYVIEDNIAEIVATIEKLLTSVTGLYCESFRFVEGRIIFVGTLPAVKEISPGE